MASLFPPFVALALGSIAAAMLKLRKQHIDAFEALAIRGFTSRVLTHIKEIWPIEFEELGDTSVADIVRSGIQRAAALGLQTEYEVVRFVDLAFILAHDFDTSPLAVWTRSILLDRKLSPGAKMDQLYQRMENEFALIEKRKGRK